MVPKPMVPISYTDNLEITINGAIVDDCVILRAVQNAYRCAESRNTDSPCICFCCQVWIWLFTFLIEKETERLKATMAVMPIVVT